MTTWEDLQEKTFSTTHIGKTETRVEGSVFNALMERVRGRVLDVGCGDGGIVAGLIKAGRTAAGLDMGDVVEVARKRHPGVEFYGMDIHQWDESFHGTWDTVISMDVIEHVEDDLRLLRRLSELAPRIIITTPSHPHKWREQEEHLRFYVPVSMARLIAIAGMVLVEHLIVIEEDTGMFVAERSDLPLEERLKKSVEAAKDPAISMLWVLDEPVLEAVQNILKPFFDYFGEVSVNNRVDGTKTVKFCGRRR